MSTTMEPGTMEVATAVQVRMRSLRVRRCTATMALLGVYRGPRASQDTSMEARTMSKISLPNSHTVRQGLSRPLSCTAGR